MIEREAQSVQHKSLTTPWDGSGEVESAHGCIVLWTLYIPRPLIRRPLFGMQLGMQLGVQLGLQLVSFLNHCAHHFHCANVNIQDISI